MPSLRIAFSHLEWSVKKKRKDIDGSQVCFVCVLKETPVLNNNASLSKEAQAD